MWAFNNILGSHMLFLHLLSRATPNRQDCPPTSPFSQVVSLVKRQNSRPYHSRSSSFNPLLILLLRLRAVSNTIIFFLHLSIRETSIIINGTIPSLQLTSSPSPSYSQGHNNFLCSVSVCSWCPCHCCCYSCCLTSGCLCYAAVSIFLARRRQPAPANQPQLHPLLGSPLLLLPLSSSCNTISLVLHRSLLAMVAATVTIVVCRCYLSLLPVSLLSLWGLLLLPLSSSTPPALLFLLRQATYFW